MHELAITESILRIAKSEAEKHNASRVLSIKLKVGELSGVVPTLIQEYFNIVSNETLVEGAKLIIDRIPITIKCSNCGYEGGMDKMKRKCPECYSYDIKILTGREFYVESLEVE